MSNISTRAPAGASFTRELGAVFDLIAQGSNKRDLEREHPYEAMHLIRQTRLGALRIKAEDGGSGVSLREFFAVMIRLAEADSNVAHIMRNHYVFVERYAREPRDERERQWQKMVLDGKIVGLANHELDAKNVGASPYATVFKPDGDGYRLSGKKYYSTGTLYSDLVLVRAVDESGKSASVIVPLDREGVEALDDWDGMGQRMTATGTTIFTDVRVEPSEIVFDGPGIGYGVAYSSTLPQLFLTAVNAGNLRAMARDAVALVKRRGRSFYYAPTERPIDDPLLQMVVGEISSYAFACEAAVLAAADAQDAISESRSRGVDDQQLALDAAALAAKAKVVVDELVMKAGGRLFDVGGASAAVRAQGLDRHWRNARTVASHNPTSYKARAIGDLEINGTPLPPKNFF